MPDTATRPLRDFAIHKGLIGGPFGSNLVKADYTESGVPVIRGQNLSGSGFFSSRDFAYVSEEKANGTLSRNLALPNDIVFTQRGTLGQVGIVPNEPHERYVVSQSQMRLRIDRSRTDARYIYYCFRDPAMVARIHARAITTGVPHINLGILAELPIPDHPLPIQRAIAEVLGALDDKIAVNERIAETALALAKAHMEAVDQTVSVRVSDVAKIFDGPHATPQKTTEGPWFLSISSLKGGLLDLAESAHLTEDDFPRWTRRVQPSEGDVLFSYETRLGEVALMPPGVRASLGRRMGLLRPKPGAIRSVLLLHAYLSPPFQEEIRRRTVHGATVDRIPLKEMSNWPITLPAAGVRDQLSAALEALHTSINHVAVENRTLADLRSTLLPQLISGKICVKDAMRVVEDFAS
ncbi:restriction endonuclease subunit S [Streptomyces lavendulae]|uniref:restriction endonuclease subunit S n=1 Tax=Streptomyces lavendulae TaxID=1914 RepID=UPI0031E75B46